MFVCTGRLVEERFEEGVRIAQKVAATVGTHSFYYNVVYHLPKPPNKVTYTQGNASTRPQQWLCG